MLCRCFVKCGNGLFCAFMWQQCAHCNCLQAAQEKETGRLSATVSLPQIPKAIAKMAAEAKHEIMIEQTVDKRNKAVKAARKEAAAKKIEDKKAAAKALAAKAAKTVGLDSDSA